MSFPGELTFSDDLHGSFSQSSLYAEGTENLESGPWESGVLGLTLMIGET